MKNDKNALPFKPHQGLAQPSSNFQRVRDGRVSLPLYYAVDLTNARSIAAGTALALPIAGNVFYADPLYDLNGNSVAGIARVHFQDTNLGAQAQGAPFTVLPQFITRFPFTQLLVENYAQPGKFLAIAYGVDVDIQPGLSNQVLASIVGTASVDQLITTAAAAKQRDLITANNNAFIAVISQGAAAANYSHCQLKNGAASGKTVYVDRISGYSQSVASFYRVTLYDTDCTTDGSGWLSKYDGGAAGIARTKSQNNAAQLGVSIALKSFAAGAPMEFNFDPPIRLDQGKGVVVVPDTVNQSNFATFEGREY